jgi:WD repeat-containing protein 20
MADSNGKDDLKTQFLTREGIYRLLTLSEYSRPKVGYQSNQSSPQVRVSLVTLPSPNPQPQALHHQQQQQQQTPSSQQHPSSSTSSNGLDRDTAAIVPTGGDRICFNIGKELLIYAYRGVKKVGIEKVELCVLRRLQNLWVKKIQEN